MFPTQLTTQNHLVSYLYSYFRERLMYKQNFLWNLSTLNMMREIWAGNGFLELVSTLVVTEIMTVDKIALYASLTDTLPMLQLSAKNFSSYKPSPGLVNFYYSLFRSQLKLLSVSTCALGVWSHSLLFYSTHCTIVITFLIFPIRL